MAGVRVDPTDFRILKEIFCGEESFRQERVPLDAIAKKLGLHRNTVSSRVRKLTEGRIFLPTSLDVEPGALGLVAALAFLDVPRERRTLELRAELYALPGVQTLFLLHEGWEVIAFAPTLEELLATLERARVLAGASAAKLDILSTRDYPHVEPVALTPLDARIIAALLADARASFDEVAGQAGVTAMTVKRRFDRLTEEGVLFVYPTMQGEVEGVVLGFLLVDVPASEREAAVKNALVKEIPDHFIRNLATQGRAHFFLFASSLTELEAVASRARRVAGVAGVELRILNGLATNPRHADWLASAVGARAARAAPR